MKESIITARITASHRERFEISSEMGEGYARLKRSAWRDAGEMYPTVGDYVRIEYNPSGDSMILSTLPRKSLFQRADGWTKRGVQAVAANFDSVLIVTSMNHEFSMRRLERYLAMALESGAQPVLVLTKLDLCPQPEAYLDQARTLEDRMPVFAVSSMTGEGIDRLRARFARPGQTLVLLGSSGVGKSSLVNALSGSVRMQTAAIREDDAHGRHTTTRRQLLPLDGGAFLIDTPGMRELGMWDSLDGVNETFADLHALAARCRFADCTHRVEPGCAIRGALEAGEVDPARVRNFLTIGEEARKSAKRAQKRRRSACKDAGRARDLPDPDEI